MLVPIPRPIVRQALKGLVVMTLELEGMSNALFVQKIPENWARATSRWIPIDAAPNRLQPP